MSLLVIKHIHEIKILAEEYWAIGEGFDFDPHAQKKVWVFEFIFMIYLQ